MPVGSVQREESGRRRPAQRCRGRRPTQRRRVGGRSCEHQGQEMRAASAVGGRSSDVGGGGLRSGGEGRSCGGFDHQGEEQRCQGQELGAATAGVERGGSGEERKKIRIFMFLWAVGCR
jgi:hypothetical protein